MSHLKLVGPNIWVIDRPHSMMGIELGVRSILVQRDDLSTILISPGPFTDEIWRDIDSVGEVSTLIAPNIHHHLFLADAAKRAPTATIYLAEGLSERHRDLPTGVDIEDGRLAVLAPDLHAITLQGTTTHETVFWQPRSKTLIVTDLVFNLQEGGLWTRTMMRLNDGYGKFGPTKKFLSTIEDRAAFRASLEQVFSWDFEQIIMAHGVMVDRHGKTMLREAFESV